MATYLQNLITRRDNIAAELAAITSTSAGGKPDASKSGVQHIAYVNSLNEQLEKLNGLIDKEQLNAGGSDAQVFEITSIAET